MTVATSTIAVAILCAMLTIDVFITLLDKPDPLPVLPNDAYGDSTLIMTQFAGSFTRKLRDLEDAVKSVPIASLTNSEVDRTGRKWKKHGGVGTRKELLSHHNDDADDNVVKKSSRKKLLSGVSCGASHPPMTPDPAFTIHRATKAIDTILNSFVGSSDKFVENITFATNSGDKIPYQLRNLEPMKHRFAEPQWNDVPLISQEKKAKKSLLIGISSVNRKTNYLFNTVSSFVKALNDQDAHRTQIIIFNADFPASKHKDIPRVKSHFSTEIEVGLIKIVEAEEAHPQLKDETKLARRWGDDLHRVKWRSKQVLDVAYLMNYAQKHHNDFRYFLMMEDDIIPTKNYVSKLRKWVDSNLATRTDWMIASFYNPWEVQDLEELPPFKFFGVIGQLFRLHDLPVVVEFLRKNFDQSPLDWLFVDFLKKFDGKMVVHTPSLFQHQGTVSSLDGKEQSGRAVDFDDDKG